MDKKVDLVPHSKRCSKSLGFLRLVDIAANQQPVCTSSNNYETNDQALSNQAKQILTLSL